MNRRICWQCRHIWEGNDPEIPWEHHPPQNPDQCPNCGSMDTTIADRGRGPHAPLRLGAPPLLRQAVANLHRHPEVRSQVMYVMIDLHEGAPEDVRTEFERLLAKIAEVTLGPSLRWAGGGRRQSRETSA